MVKNWKSTLLALGLGQLLSLLVTFAAFTSSQLAKLGIDAPASQCVLTYVLLALVYGGIFIYKEKPFKADWGFFTLMVGYLDVKANFFLITAYQYTPLTNVMLLDCWTIPFALLLTWLFLKTKYGFRKLIGVATCVAGLLTLVYSDIHSVDELPSDLVPLKGRGDLLIIVGAALYAIIYVIEEIIFKKADRVELMASLGIFGVLACYSRISKYEANEFESILSSLEAIFLVIGFSFAMFLFYTGVPLLLKISGSKMLNLSLLTSNIWAVLIQIFVSHEKVDCMYFVALAAVTLGLIIFLGEDEMDTNTVFDEKVDLGRSNMKGFKISFQGARNSMCYIWGNVRK